MSEDALKDYRAGQIADEAARRLELLPELREGGEAMSMLGSQCERLRDRAKILRQGDWSDGADDAALMEQAADTITSLRGRLQPVPAELDYIEDKSRWFQLFGTPEKAVDYFALRCIGSEGEACSGCPFELACDARSMRLGSLANIKARMLELLNGEVYR